MKTKKTQIAMIVMAIITCIAVGAAIYTFWHFTHQAKPDYPVITVEDNQIPLGDGADEKMDQPENGGSVNMTYSIEVQVDNAQGIVNLNYQNPSRSNASVVLSILVGDTLIAQSGAITPGNMLNQLPLMAGNQLAPGTYDGIFQLNFYNTETNEQAMANSEIAVTITVI